MSDVCPVCGSVNVKQRGFEIREEIEGDACHVRECHCEDCGSDLEESGVFYWYHGTYDNYFTDADKHGVLVPRNV